MFDVGETTKEKCQCDGYGYKARHADSKQGKAKHYGRFQKK
jgi:hypothetical protein